MPLIPTVLVVEDDESVRCLAEMVLTNAGYAVRGAGSPRAALALLAENAAVDVVLTDVLLPEMTGYDFVEEAHRLAPEARVVFMSGNTSDQFRRGTDERFLRKPFTLSSLRTIVEQAFTA
jgi:two-component system cell cycle sensor histidine kinase/response regulator CckA